MMAKAMHWLAQFVCVQLSYLRSTWAKTIVDHARAGIQMGSARPEPLALFHEWLVYAKWPPCPSVLWLGPTKGRCDPPSQTGHTVAAWDRTGRGEWKEETRQKRQTIRSRPKTRLVAANMLDCIVFNVARLILGPVDGKEISN